MIARLRGQQLSAPAYDFLLSGEDSGEAVAVACEATSFDPAKAELRTLAAVRIRGNRILASRHLAVAFRPGEPPEPALDRFLRLIGNRPLVGYYLDFTVDLIDRSVQPMTGTTLPNERIEVSSLYYESRLKVPGKNALNLRLDAILAALDLPERAADDAYANAIAAAMVYLRLKAEE